MQSKSESQQIAKRVGLGVLIVLLFLALVQWFFPQSLQIFRDVYWRVLGPVARVPYTTDETSTLEQQLQTTQAALYNSIFDYVELQRLRQENKELKNSILFSASSTVSRIGTTILGETNIGGVQFFILNVGSKDGIAKGYPVIADAGFLVGIVTEVGYSTSYVVPVQENSFSLSARVLGNNGRIHGVVEGVPGLATRLQLIPQDIQLEVGQAIITSGLDPHIPADLIIGYIDSLIPTPHEFFQSALIRFAGSYTEFETFFVLTPDTVL